MKQALDGTRLNAFAMDPDKLVIVEDTRNALFDERVKLPLDEALVLNIMVYGVLEPVLVRKTPDGMPEVIDGRQRVRCAREANKRLAKEGKEPIRVPVMAKRGDDAHMFGVSVSANEQRQDDDVLTKAQKVGRYLDMGRTEKEAALAFGVTRQSIRNWLKLLELSPEVQKAVRAGELSSHAAAQIATLPRDEQVQAMAKAKDKKAGTQKRVTAKDMARKPTAPSKRVLKRIAASNQKKLPRGFVLGIRYAMGLVEEDKVPGLAELLKEG